MQGHTPKHHHFPPTCSTHLIISAKCLSPSVNMCIVMFNLCKSCNGVSGSLSVYLCAALCTVLVAFVSKSLIVCKGNNKNNINLRLLHETFLIGLSISLKVDCMVHVNRRSVLTYVYDHRTLLSPLLGSVGLCVNNNKSLFLHGHLIWYHCIRYPCKHVQKGGSNSEWSHIFYPPPPSSLSSITCRWPESHEKWEVWHWPPCTRVCRR